jgi:hypothetical protein
MASAADIHALMTALFASEFEAETARFSANRNAPA